MLPQKTPLPQARRVLESNCVKSGEVRPCETRMHTAPLCQDSAEPMSGPRTGAPMPGMGSLCLMCRDPRRTERFCRHPNEEGGPVHRAAFDSTSDPFSEDELEA